MRPSITSPTYTAALFVLGLLALLSLAGCGSSTSTATAPAVLPRCGVTVSPMDGAAPSQGASGQLTIKTDRECTWSAVTEASWLSIRGSSSGQGDGAIEYSVAANADPVTRRGTIAVNDQHPAISQAAADCTSRLSSSSASFPLTGGSGSVDLQPSSALCTWSAASEADWIVIRSAVSGTGNATIRFDVAATTGPARTGNLLIGGQRFSVTQSQGCTYSVAPSSQSVGSAGGNGSIAVSTAAGCPWTAASNVNWAAVSGSTSGTGPGTVGFVVDPTNGPPREGTLLIAGHTVAITQASACTFNVSPATHAIPATGGPGSVGITAVAGCAWTASSNAPWITISGQTSGSGNGTVGFTVAASTGASRAGTLTIAGQTITVNQAEGCSFSIAPDHQDVNASGGTGSVAVTAAAGCNWTAASNASWITITSGGTGTANGTVQFTVAATTSARSGTLTIAGQTFTVNQAQACSIAIAPTSADIAVGGGTGSVAVTAANGCAWTATSNASWITVNSSGASGSGNGTVPFTVAANTGAARSGTITIGGQTFTVNQAQACSIGIAPTSANIAVGGGSGTVTVTAASGCTWTTTSSVPWITVTSGNGTGNGTVGFSVAANTGAARSGTLTIGGQTFTVNQAQACTVSIAPASSNIPAAGGNGSITVTAAAGCTWTATASENWISITSGGNGTANGTVAFTAAANSGGARSATIMVAGQVHTVNQAQACTVSIAPATSNIAAGGGNGSITVTAAAGCAWAPTASANWISITSGATGSGNGTVAFTASANTGGARTATITVGGQVHTVNQAQACTVSIAPATSNIAAGGGNGSITVTAAAGCTWTPTASASWISITSGATGSGNGTVAFTASANTGGARTATITVGGQVHTVNQAAGTACAYAIDPTEVSSVKKQGEQISVTVKTSDGCTWTATSPVSWIQVASPQNGSGAGNGTVLLDVERNTGADPRTATVTIAGKAFKVTQEGR